MNKDPVCGMKIDEKHTKYKTLYKGKNYYFCSQRCKNSFNENPEKYLAAMEDSSLRERKVVIVGTGKVGSTFAFNLMISGLANNIVLIDRSREMAEGHAKDLNHGLSFVSPTRIKAGDYKDCQDADIVVITAGVAQKSGESRLDLVRKNTEIFKELIPDIVQYNPRILLIVSNPVDILTYAALHISEYPMNRVFGSGTMLDTARFKYLLGEHCQVDSRDINAYIIGEHGDSEVPVWSMVTIGGIPLEQFCSLCQKKCTERNKKDIFEQIKNAAYEIINKKGATYFAISLALVNIVGSILRNENSVSTVSTLLDDYYGVSAVCLSIPVIINNNGISEVVKVELNKKEEKEFKHSANVLKNIISEIEI
jgi:L-lactate dehydrogenase